jgi:SUKH-3 immunity protein
LVELPEEIRPLFIQAGWHPGRRVPVSTAVPVDHPAFMISVEFGGLTVEPPEQGEECGTDDIAFRELWPDESILRVWADLLGARLVGIADIHRGHGELYAAADGRVFGRSCIHDAFWLEGESFLEAMGRSLLGRRSRPLLRPDQSSVTLYGVLFTIDSPDVYRYK